MKRYILIMFICMIFSSFSSISFAVPRAELSEKVYDYADLFTVEEEKSLYDYIINFINKNQMDMAIVTIEENDNSSAEAYADDFYDYNGFGIGDTYDGLLFLIDMDTRTMHISTTGEAILVYDDYRIEDMLDNAYYYIANGEYFNTAYSFIKDSETYAAKGIPSSNKDYEIDDAGDYVKKEAEFPILGIILISFAISGIFIGISASRHKLVKTATDAKNYLINGSLNITRKEDSFINSHTSRIYISSSTGSSGGGSSTHRGSSGRSHGGGSRRF